MRSLQAAFVALLFGWFAWLPAFCQQPAARGQAKTAEQLENQRRYSAYEAKRLGLRAQAEGAFQAEMALARAGDCHGAQSTQDFNLCFGKAVDVADGHLRTYEQALSALLALQAPGSAALTPAAGARTVAMDAAEFLRVEALWRTFMEAAAAAAYHQFDGGTGAPSFELQTHLELVREHLGRLNKIYAVTLVL